MSKVEVLCPNGHWVAVKTTPNTILLQIVEEACQKKGFLPASDYTLKHGRKLVDLTLTVRYAGLPNLAKLELVKSEKSRSESDVSLALQIPTGDRLQHKFAPSTSIWSVLSHWKETNELALYDTENPQLHPVCVYMREEVVGEAALKQTTLRKLGLTGGKAIIRFLLRAVNKDTLAAIEKQLQEETERQARLARSASQTTNSEAAPKEEAQEQEKSMQNSTAPVSEAEVPMETDVKESSSAKDTQIKSLARQTEKNVTPQTTSSETNSSAGQAGHGGIQLAPGVTMFRPGDTALSPEEQQLARQLSDRFALFPEQSEREREARQRAEWRAEQQWMREQEHRLRELQRAQPATEFKFPEETRGQSLYVNELSDVDRTEYQPCDREPVLYRLHGTGAASSAAVDNGGELPDEFFDVTEQDVHAMWNDSQRKLREIHEAPLQTRTMRQTDRDARMSRYSRAALRLQFPDGHVMQLLFRPRETVHALYSQVAQMLSQPDSKFYLYTTPPKHVLKDKACTLIQADLAPMSLVYFGSQEKKDQYLKPELLENLASFEEANATLVRHMQASGDSATQHTAVPAGASNVTSQPSTSGRSTASRPTGEAPKWFNIGKR